MHELLFASFFRYDSPHKVPWRGSRNLLSNIEVLLDVVDRGRQLDICAYLYEPDASVTNECMCVSAMQPRPSYTALAHIAFLSMCFRRNLIWVLRSKFVALSGSGSGSSSVPRCCIHRSYHLSSRRARYVSTRVSSFMCTKRCRTEFRGTAGKTCSTAPQSRRVGPRHRALMITEASRASSSYWLFQRKRCLRGVLTSTSSGGGSALAMTQTCRRRTTYLCPSPCPSCPSSSLARSPPSRHEVPATQ